MFHFDAIPAKLLHFMGRYQFEMQVYVDSKE
jgi:hypothetical protein